MKFKISRISLSKKKPHPKAEFVGFDDYDNKKYTIDIDSVEQLLDIAKQNKTDIGIFPPYEEGQFWEITVNDTE